MIIHVEFTFNLIYLFISNMGCLYFLILFYLLFNFISLYFNVIFIFLFLFIYSRLVYPLSKFQQKRKISCTHYFYFNSLKIWISTKLVIENKIFKIRSTSNIIILYLQICNVIMIYYIIKERVFDAIYIYEFFLTL